MLVLKEKINKFPVMLQLFSYLTVFLSDEKCIWITYVLKWKAACSKHSNQINQLSKMIAEGIYWTQNLVRKINEKNTILKWMFVKFYT